MKTLIVATDNRFWLNRLGSNSRILTMVQHLRAQGWQVQVAFMGHGYPVDVQSCMRLGLAMAHALPAQPMPVLDTAAKPLPRPTPRQRLRQLHRWLRAAATQLARPRPPVGWWRELALRSQAKTVADHHDPRHLALLRRLCGQLRPQAVIVEFVHLAWLAPAIPAGTLRLIDCHDVQHERQQRFHAVGEPHWLDMSAAEEARWLARFDIVIAIQRRDARLLAELVPHGRVITVMHPQPLQPPRPATAGALNVGFVGSQMPPNTLAARELLQLIWPAVHAGTQGRARLRVAGSVCLDLAGETLPPGVEVLGFVDDLDALYDDLAVIVNPVRLGGGLKIKNVEALCRGKPLVTTPLGAEGIEDGIDQAFVVEDSAAGIGRRLLDLLLDPARRQALAQGAFAYASANFETTQVFAPLDAALAATSSPADSG